jgi:hypothetical protein
LIVRRMIGPRPVGQVHSQLRGHTVA